MTACPSCHSPLGDPAVLGIQRDAKDRAALILRNCPSCRTTLSLRWEDASPQLREREVMAEARRGA